MDTRPSEPTVPKGYESVETFADAAMGLVCGTCHSVVPRSRTDAHSAWHDRLMLRLGGF